MKFLTAPTYTLSQTKINIFIDFMEYNNYKVNNCWFPQDLNIGHK